MKALKVFESINFERRKDPIDAMDIGIKSWLQDFDKNYFKTPIEKREKMREKFNQIMSTIQFEEIFPDTKYFPLEMIFGFMGSKMRSYRQFKLNHGLYLSYKEGSNIPTAYLTDEKGRPVAENSSTSSGSKGVNTFLERVRKTAKIKFLKPRK
jgi:hypothetical protein